MVLLPVRPTEIKRLGTSVISCMFNILFINLCWIFDKLPDCFPKQLHYLTFPSAVYEGCDFTTSFTTLVIIWLFDSSHPNECEMANSLSFSLRWWCAKLILYNIISFLKDSVWMMKRRIFMLLFSFFISFHPAVLFTFSILRLVHSPLSFTSLLKNVDCYCQIARIQ